MKRASRFLPTSVASLVFLALFVGIGLYAYRHDDRHLIFVLDDAYIHSAMAETFADHGVWGLTERRFSSSTSSPLWVLLLAAVYKAFGSLEFVLAGVVAFFALLSLAFTDLLCRSLGMVDVGRRTAACLAVIFLTPLVPLCATGMEHCLHLCLVLAMFYYAAEYLALPSRSAAVGLCAAALLATATRFETPFLIAPLAVVLVARRRFFLAIALAICGAIPIVSYGIVSKANGSFFLPNSLVVKGAFPSTAGITAILNSLGGRSLETIGRAPHMFVLLALLLATAWLRARDRSPVAPLAAVLAIAMVGHCQFADLGWFYRYEAYLVGTSVAIVSAAWLPRLNIPDFRRSHSAYSAAAALALACLLFYPLVRRAGASLVNIPTASRNIYEQQFQFSRLFKDELGTDPKIALNDIGAAAYFADIDMLDLVGLGTIEVTRLKRAGALDTQAIAGLLAERGIDYVVVYDKWFVGKQSLPDTLVPVARWTIDNNKICGDATVSFYGTTPHSADRLSEAMHRFEARLPKTVAVRYGKPAPLASSDDPAERQAAKIP